MIKLVDFTACGVLLKKTHNPMNGIVLQKKFKRWQNILLKHEILNKGQTNDR